MAVGASTASESRPDGPVGPIRTCIGCRQRAVAAELFRVVAAPDVIDTPRESVPIVPDPRRRMPGRGAWLHLDRDCVELATRRRAFVRALRVSGTVDPTPVIEYVAQARSGKATTAPPPAETRRR